MTSNNKGSVVWVFGRPCAGKTTLAKSIERELSASGIKTITFDGDELRRGLNKDLEFSIEDRKENIRRAAELARLFASKGYAVVCSFVTPTKEMRQLVKSVICSYPLFLVFAKAPLEICISRDVKGHYKKAKEGIMIDFTGVSSPFEEPVDADCVIKTDELNLADATKQSMALLSPLLEI